MKLHNIVILHVSVLLVSGRLTKNYLKYLIYKKTQVLDWVTLLSGFTDRFQNLSASTLFSNSCYPETK